MYANHNQLIRILGLELLEIRNHMHAVDAAVGPEIEENDFSFETRECNRVVRVQPGNTSLQLWSVNRLAGHRFSFLGLGYLGFWNGCTCLSPEHRKSQNGHE